MTRITDEATGTSLPHNRDLFRIAVTLHGGTFDEVKSRAIQNNRSLSQEMRTIVEAAIWSSKRAEDQF